MNAPKKLAHWPTRCQTLLFLVARTRIFFSPLCRLWPWRWANKSLSTFFVELDASKYFRQTHSTWFGALILKFPLVSLHHPLFWTGWIICYRKTTHERQRRINWTKLHSFLAENHCESPQHRLITSVGSGQAYNTYRFFYSSLDLFQWLNFYCLNAISSRLPVGL